MLRNSIIFTSIYILLRDRTPVGRDIPHQSRPVLEPTQPLVQRIPGLSRGKAAGDVALTTHIHLTVRLKKKQSCNSTPPTGPSCNVPGCTLPLPLPVHFYIYLIKLCVDGEVCRIQIQWTQHVLVKVSFKSGKT